MIILTNKKVCSFGQSSRGVVIPREFIKNKKYIHVLIFDDSELREISGVVRNGV
jgi:hypothetical protein